MIARRATFDRGLLPDFEPALLTRMKGLSGTASITGGAIRDATHLLWVSIDNDDSRDLDQMSVAQ